MGNEWLEFVKWSKQMAKEYPASASDILDIVSLAQDEIEGGGSERHEIELAKEDIKDFIYGFDRS